MALQQLWCLIRQKKSACDFLYIILASDCGLDEEMLFLFFYTLTFLNICKFTNCIHYYNFFFLNLKFILR